MKRKDTIRNYIPLVDDYVGARTRLVDALSTVTCRDRITVSREVDEALHLDVEQHGSLFYMLDPLTDFLDGVDNPDLNNYFQAKNILIKGKI